MELRHRNPLLYFRQKASGSGIVRLCFDELSNFMSTHSAAPNAGCMPASSDGKLFDVMFDDLERAAMGSPPPKGAWWRRTSGRCDAYAAWTSEECARMRRR